MAVEAKRTGFHRIEMGRIRLWEDDDFDPKADPLQENVERPVIAMEGQDGRYLLLDGYEVFSGLRNGGAEHCWTILISDDDFGDLRPLSDPDAQFETDIDEWLELVWAKYVPHLTYPKAGV